MMFQGLFSKKNLIFHIGIKKLLTASVKKISVWKLDFIPNFNGVLGTVCMCDVRENDLHHFTHADAYLWSHPSAPRQISQTV